MDYIQAPSHSGFSKVCVFTFFLSFPSLIFILLRKRGIFTFIIPPTLKVEGHIACLSVRVSVCVSVQKKLVRVLKFHNCIIIKKYLGPELQCLLKVKQDLS